LQPGKQLGTLSYGKEKPTCAEATEACWAKNRRAETKVRSRTVVEARNLVTSCRDCNRGKSNRLISN
jgi:hypothetical protein